MAYTNTDSQSVGKVENAWLINKTISDAIRNQLAFDYENNYRYDTDKYRKKLGLILSILKG